MCRVRHISMTRCCQRASISIGATEPSARVPNTNLSLPPSRSASLPLRSSHTLTCIFTVRGCAACASTTIHIAHRHHVALSGRQLPSHSVVAPLTRNSAGVVWTVMAWWHASPIHVATSLDHHSLCHVAAVSLASPGAPGAGRIAPCAQAQASQSCSLLWWRCGDLCRAF